MRSMMPFRRPTRPAYHGNAAQASRRSQQANRRSLMARDQDTISSGAGMDLPRHIASMPKHPNEPSPTLSSHPRDTRPDRRNSLPYAPSVTALDMRGRGLENRSRDDIKTYNSSLRFEYKLSHEREAHIS